ncbi:hypothetical protein BDD12DRAFT_945079, partial [Trichophaea hybrida]
ENINLTFIERCTCLLKPNIHTRLRRTIISWLLLVMVSGNAGCININLYGTFKQRYSRFHAGGRLCIHHCLFDYLLSFWSLGRLFDYSSSCHSANSQGPKVLSLASAMNRPACNIDFPFAIKTMEHTITQAQFIPLLADSTSFMVLLTGNRDASSFLVLRGFCWW